MELLESSFLRPRQARYQAALRPDMKCEIHSKALSNFTPNPSHAFYHRQELCITQIRACNMHAASTCKSSGSMGCCPV
jgi:hypothetical protein